MIVLDTNVISAIMSDPPVDAVADWIDHQAQQSIWTTSINVFEIRSVLHTMPAGRRQARLSEVFEQFLEGINRRVAEFDYHAAELAAELAAAREKKGRPGDLRDTMIAGIVLAHHASLATRNVAHFADIRATVVDPWTSK